MVNAPPVKTFLCPTAAPALSTIQTAARSRKSPDYAARGELADRHPDPAYLMVGTRPTWAAEPDQFATVTMIGGLSSPRLMAHRPFTRRRSRPAAASMLDLVISPTGVGNGRGRGRRRRGPFLSTRPPLHSGEPPTAGQRIMRRPDSPRYARGRDPAEHGPLAATGSASWLAGRGRGRQSGHGVRGMAAGGARSSPVSGGRRSDGAPNTAPAATLRSCGGGRQTVMNVD